MSRQTVTLTAPNGAKVRTVRSKIYFVVSYSDVPLPDGDTKPVAAVVRRTDSPNAALTRLRELARGVCFALSPLDGEYDQVDARVLAWRIADEKAARKAGL